MGGKIGNFYWNPETFYDYFSSKYCEELPSGVLSKVEDLLEDYETSSGSVPYYLVHNLEGEEWKDFRETIRSDPNIVIDDSDESRLGSFLNKVKDYFRK